MAITKDNAIQIAVKENKLVAARLLEKILGNSKVKRYLKGIRFRVLDTQFYEADEKERKQFKLQSNFSNFYQVTAYDYTNNRCIFIRADAENNFAIEITDSAFQPEPNDEEYEEAIGILLEKNERLRRGVKEQAIRLYKPMPPTIDVPLPTGEVVRTLSLGIHSMISGIKSEIVGVNMISREVFHLDENRFGGAGNHSHCGVPGSGQSTTSKGTAGQSWITVTQGGQVIWKFLVIRPSASSGTKGSGIELKYVDYKRKRVLYQGHVPILNVRYDNDACGPYRDWQYQEDMFEANGNDVAPGIRICTSPAKTVLDSGNDTGNFKGVAIYVIGQEVVLVSEMQAGWYRYISEWRLHTNGTIKPRFGFAAVQNSCVCNKHHHHVYWRLDLDIGTPGNNLVEEFNDPALIGNSKWHKKSYEIRRLKDASRKRKWRVKNTVTGEGYEIIPGENDGDADSFGVGDLWVLRYHGGAEIDDGVTSVGGTPEQCKAHLDNFLTGENVENKDVVIWYAAHFTHDVHEEVGHIVGPTLKPI